MTSENTSQSQSNSTSPQMANQANNTPKSPKKWKLMFISWLFVYPVINIMFALVFPLVKDFPQLLKTLVFTVILVPLMGFCIPIMHKKFWNWITK